MLEKKNQWLLYFIGSIVFLSIPFLNTDPRYGKGFFDLGHMVKQDLVRFPLLLVFFYLNYFYLVPRLYFSKKYFWYIVIIIAAMLVIAELPGMIFREGPPHFPSQDFGKMNFAPPRPHGFFSRINHNLFLFFAVVFLSLLISVRNRWKETQKEKVDAELQYLKAQINPHFLFNTLNSIYSLAIQKHESTPEAVQKLSAMMRYVLTHADNNVVPLETEIDYLRNYIDLQKLRFGSEVKLNYSINGNASGKTIAPLMLIPFIENAFKYGMNAEEDTDINIMIDISDDSLEMNVINNKVTVHVSPEKRTGIGIGNTRNRLDYLYPNTHKLQISEDEKKFHVKLIIQLV